MASGNNVDMNHEMRPREDQKIVQRAMNLFFVLFLLVGFVLGGGVAVLYHFDKSSYLEELRTLESHSLDLQSIAISDEFDHVVGDVLFLAQQNELLLHLDTGEATQIKEMQREYIRLASSKPVYDQIRFLDAKGVERVRVNNRNGLIESVPADKLQDKRNRYYFTDCLALGEQDIFVSPLDLNIENGRVEEPLNPMIRFGTPVFDSAGRKRGIVLINYAAESLLQRIHESSLASEGVSMLMNTGGYWLLSPDKGKDWGFMFQDRNDQTFARDYPGEWQRMVQSEQGQFKTDNGLFTYKKIYPLKEGQHFKTNASSDTEQQDTSEYFWVLLSQVPTKVLNEHTRSLLFRLFLGGGALFMVVAFGAWQLALAISRRRMYQAQLIAMAMYDSLTGLPNRKLFFDRLAQGLSNAKRYEHKLGLIYLDLDGFKKVNDTKGHEAGDELLIQVGAALSGIVRKSDTVARLGGDEFAIILSQIKDVEEAARVGEKVVQAICQSFTLGVGVVEIGASAGVAVYPDHEDSEKELVRSADRAMYESKATGKGNCTVITSSRPEPSD